MTVERDLGRIEGALKAHEDRMDRTDDAIKTLSASVNNRFDGVKLHLDRQDEKLDVLIRRSDREEGADGARRVWFENNAAGWAKLCGIVVALATIAQVFGHAIITTAAHMTGYHS